MNTNIRIGDVLKQYGYVTEEQLQDALNYQKLHKNTRIGDALITLGFVTEQQTLDALAKLLNYRVIDIANTEIKTEAVEKIPRALAEKYCMMGIDVKDGVLVLAVNDPMNLYGIEDIKQLTGMQVEIVLCQKAPLMQAIRYNYTEVDAVKAANKANIASIEPEVIQLDEAGDDTPIINLLNSLVFRAYSTGASDIHIEPFETKTLVRMRIDGVIADYVTLQKGIQAPLIARIKILSELDIAERRIPQDGHFRVNIDNEPLNIRVSLIPTVFGEKAVLRLLSGNYKIDHAASYGMREENYEKFKTMLGSPNGIIYLTGPTGCGKTTTLYMVLDDFSKKPINVSTIEDPVEKNLMKINQMQVNNTAGLTFESGLRALLRQDPDVIMVGETRDAQTASISVSAAITGHLVFSTLHTNDAASSVARLKDMGLEPYMISTSLVGVIAQRLMRKVCPECSVEAPLTQREIEFIGEDIGKVKIAKGCHFCNNTGYRGRIAVHEILMIDKAVRDLITNGATSEEIADYAVKHQNMLTLKAGGIELVKAGITTLEELAKIAYND